jgi:outer membrane lipoprotein-sorting protein
MAKKNRGVINMKNKIKLIILFILLIVCISGCAVNTSLMPEAVLQKVIENDDKKISYAMKLETKTYEKDNLKSTTKIKEYYDSQNKRSRMNLDSDVQGQKLSWEYLINNNQITMYNKTKNILYKTKDIKEIEEIQSLRVQPKDFVTNMLKASRETNKITNEGEEKISGIKTIHISIIPKEKGPFEERNDFWVSKENWAVIKSVMKIGDTTIESKYTDIDFSPKFDEVVFKLDIPDDIKIKDLSEMYKDIAK